MGGQEKTCNPAAVEYQVNRWRAIHNIITSYEFRDLFTHYGTMEVQQWIDEGNLDKVRSWIKTVKHGPLAEKPVDELRVIASRYKIRYYGKMSKTQLLVAITRRCPNAS